MLRIPRIIKTARGKLDFADLNRIRKRFARYVRPYWKSLLVAFVASIAAVMMKIAYPLPIKLVFDVVLTDAMSHKPIGQWFARHAPDPTMALGIICGMILIIALGETGFTYLNEILMARTGQNVVGKLRQSLFRHMQRLSPDVFESRRTGDLLTRLTGDIQMLRQMIVTAWMTACQNLLTILTIIAVMFWLNPQLALVATATIPLIAVTTAHISQRLRHVAKDQREKEGVIASVAHEVLGAITVVQAFNREHVEAQRFARQNRSSIRAGLKATRLEAKLFRVVSLASAVGLCAVLFLGARYVVQGTMTAGDLLVFVAYVRSVQKPLRKLSKLAGQAAKATTCGLRIAEILEIPPAITDAPNALQARGPQSSIQFDGVSFSYPNGTTALRELSLSVKAGERVAIVGRSGAGKSTLMKLLLRFYDPTAGALLMDGVDIRRFTVASLRDQIAVVQQNTVLFGLTVAENIALGRPEASEEEIRRVAQCVGADSFIEALPQKYETKLSERGTTLSGGQRQRIALARALLCDTPVLLLDEPVSGLDAELAQLAEQTWMAAGRDQTVIVICHHYFNMERYDQIVVLDEGRLIGSGRHRDLRQRCLYYDRLCRAWQLRARHGPDVEEQSDVFEPEQLAL